MSITTDNDQAARERLQLWQAITCSSLEVLRGLRADMDRLAGIPIDPVEHVIPPRAAVEIPEDSLALGIGSDPEAITSGRRGGRTP